MILSWVAWYSKPEDGPKKEDDGKVKTKAKKEIYRLRPRQRICTTES